MRIGVGLLLVVCFAAVVAIGMLAGDAAQAAASDDEYDLDISELENPVVTTGNAREDKVTAKPQEKYATTTEMKLASEEQSAGDEIDRLITYLTIFALAIFVGFEVITKVPPTLHTPLMSGSNAISGITIVGAILAGVSGDVQGREFLAGGLAFAAAVLAMLNVAGGFLVTNRMLQMFRKKDRA